MTDHGTTFTLLSILTLATIFAIFGMKYFSAARLSRRASDTEAGILQALNDLKSANGEIRERVGAIEAKLSEID